MQTFTASQAKQNFGALLSQLAHSPVAIARHNKTVAVVMLPAAAAALPNPRLQARADQQQREQQRLMRHQQLAIDLLCAPPAQQALQLQAAQAVVARWATQVRHLLAKIPTFLTRPTNEFNHLHRFLT